MRCPKCKSQSVIPERMPQTRQIRYLCLACQHPFQPRNSIRFRLGISGVLLGFASLLVHTGLATMMGDPTDTQPVQAIVVLGRGPAQNAARAAIAAQRWEAQPSASIFVSGMSDAPIIMKQLREMGVPEHQVRGERCSQTTWENGLFSQVLLAPRQIQRILLVTDRPHMPRAATVFRSFGFEVVPHPLALEPSWLRVQQYFRELGGLIVYGATGKLNASKSELARESEAEANFKLKRWNCRLGKP